MSTGILILIGYLLLALGFSFLCSILEAALLCITPSFVAAELEEGTKLGERLEELKDDVDRPLAAILSLNTIAHTVGAAGVGAQSLKLFGNEYVAITSALLTLAILFLSEITPKTLGAVYWKRLTPFVAWLLPKMIIGLYPLVWTSQKITKVLAPNKEGPTLSREEFQALANIVVNEGIFQEQESLILRNLALFSTLRARDIMTPRTVLVGFREDETVSKALADEDRLRFSRFPIYEDDVDDITGYVLKHDMLLKVAHSEGDTQLMELKRELLVLPSLIRVPDLLESMLKNKEHMVLLVGEYGGTAGIVTLEDVVETMLGMEIVDEFDQVEDMQHLAREQWRKRASALGIVPALPNAQPDAEPAEDE